MRRRNCRLTSVVMKKTFSLHENCSGLLAVTFRASPLIMMVIVVCFFANTITLVFAMSNINPKGSLLTTTVSIICCSSSLLLAKRTVLSAYLRLLIDHLFVTSPHASFVAFRKIAFEYMLNSKSDSMQPYLTLFMILISTLIIILCYRYQYFENLSPMIKNNLSNIFQ